MASLHLQTVNSICRRVLKPLIARTGTPEQARSALEISTALGLRPPPFTLFLPGGCHTWISAPRPEPRKAILYFHGGGYIAGSARTHRAMLGRLAERSGLRVAVGTYRLAPEHPAPAQFEDACAAHSGLMDAGYRPGDIVLGGDSAGGGLALALLADLCSRDAHPAGLFAFSPWTDLTLQGSTLKRNAESDRLLPVERIEELLGYVLGPTSPDDPRVSPLLARFDAPPPVLIQVADTEILADDAIRMAEKLNAAGGEVTLQRFADAPHVLQLFDGIFPEARGAITDAAAFARQCLNLPPLSRVEN